MQKTQSKTQECNISNSRSSLMQRWKCAGLLHTCVDYLICCEENMSVQNSLPRCQSFLGGCKSNGDVFYRRKWGECFMHVHVDARMSCRSEQIPSSALLKMTRHCPALLKWICRSWDDDKDKHHAICPKKPPLLTGIILSVINSWLLFYVRRNCEDLYRPACCSRFVAVSCEWITSCGFYSSATAGRSSTAKEMWWTPTHLCISDKSTCCVCPCKTPWDHARAFWEVAKW